MTWTQAGSLGASGLGEALFWRGSRETPKLINREIGRPSDVADPTRTQARRVAYNRVFEDELPSDIAVLLQQRFGYTEAEADAILRDVAIELFARQPGLYVQTLARAVRRAAGRHGADARRARASPAASCASRTPTTSTTSGTSASATSP